MPLKKLALVLFITTIAVLYFAGGGEKYMSIQLYQDLYARSPLTTLGVFFAVFLVATACSLPVTGGLSLASGIVFGATTGFIVSLLASTLGGTVALLSTRYLLRDLIKRRFAGQVEVVNKGIESEGAFFLFGLRMIPVIPFGLLNLLVGLTSMRVPLFMLATLTGMVPVILILAYAGSELGNIDSFSVSAIFTPGLILALTLLAAFPFLARYLVTMTRRYSRKE
jgi:uncharacterized membrane protein YdjX (TVP38/TMEM64 family)